MGVFFDFHCPACGYRAEVSGGDDCGMESTTTTILCEECQKLYDIGTGQVPWKEPLATEDKPVKLAVRNGQGSTSTNGRLEAHAPVAKSRWNRERWWRSGTEG